MATLDILGLGSGAPVPAAATTSSSSSGTTDKGASSKQQQPSSSTSRKPAATAHPATASSSSSSSSSASSSSRSVAAAASSMASLSMHSSPAGTVAASSQASQAASASPSSSDLPLATARTSSGVVYSVPHIAGPPASSLGAQSRARWTERQLSLRSGEFTEKRPLRLFVGSWNVNGKFSRGEDLGAWLLHRVKCKSGGAASPEDGEEGEDGEEDGEEVGGADEMGEEGESARRFKAPDVYVVGFQEIVDLNAGNLLVDHSASEPWEDRISSTLLRTGRRYVKVVSVHLVGLSMAVWVKEKHVEAVADVRVDQVGVGIMGVGGNKGAVLVRLRLYRTTFAFVNSHLAAHQGAVRARNADWWNIVRRASFEGSRKALVRTPSGLWIDPQEHRRLVAASSAAAQGGGGLAASVDNLAASASSFFESMRSKATVIMDNVQARKNASSASASASSGAFQSTEDSPEGVDAAGSASFTAEELEAAMRKPHGLYHGVQHIVWLGDNNYRLNVVELGMAATHALIRERNWDRLLQYDQLLAERKARRTFVGFTEPPIRFGPTYKFIPGTSEYDQRPEKKIRFPAYTDRIQYLTTRSASEERGLHRLRGSGLLDLNSMHALFYSSAPRLTASDHKPVQALLEAEVVFEREKSRRRVVGELEMLSDEETVPRALLSTGALDFGVVPFDYAVTRTLQLRNVGDAVFAYRMYARAPGASVESPRPWLRISPSRGVLQSGQVQTLVVTIWVRSRNGAGSAQTLTSGADSLECELVLKLDGGHAFLLPLSGEYEKSVCGVELSFLNALPARNLRKVDPAEVLANEDAFSVPQFLFRMLDFMAQRKDMLRAKQGAFVEPPYLSHEEEALHEDDEDDVDGEEASEEEEESGDGSTRRRGHRWPQQRCTHEMRWILSYLDTGRSLDREPKESKWRSPAAPPPSCAPVDLPASAFWHTLLYWLSSLPSPLLTASPSQRWETGMDLTAYCYQMLLELDVDKYRTIAYVLSFVRQIVSNHRSNGCHVPSLSSHLGIALCHRSASSPLSPIMPLTPPTIVAHLITSSDFANLPPDNSQHQQARQEAMRNI